MTFLLIPYTRLTLKTTLSAQEAEERLAQRTRPRRLLQMRMSWGKKDDAHDFAGTVENGRFNINRIITYRNSFLPIVIGQFHNDLGFTRVEITMRLHVLVMAFLVVWVTGFLSGALLPLLTAGDDLGGLGVSALFVGFVFFFLLIVIVTFNYEANKAREMLEALWNTEFLA